MKEATSQAVTLTLLAAPSIALMALMGASPSRSFGFTGLGAKMMCATFWLRAAATFAFWSIAATGTLADAPGRSAGSDALDRLVAVSNAVCVAPEDYGYSIDGKAGAGFQANVPKLIAKIFTFNLSGSLNGEGEYHKGIAQKDVGSAGSARNTCAEHVFTQLLDHFSFTDLSTGLRVKRPASPRAAFRAHANSAPSQATTNTGPITVSGGSGFVAGVNQGPVTINNTSPAPPTPSPTSSAARIVVTKYLVVPVDQSDANTNYFIKLFFKNTGNSAGYAPTITSQLDLLDHNLALGEIAKSMNDATAHNFGNHPAREQQIEAGQEVYLPLPQVIAHADWADVLAKKKKLYLFIAFQFLDDQPKDGEVWVTQYCGAQDYDTSTQQICWQKTYLRP